MTEEGASDWLNPELLNRIVAHQLELKSRLSETGARVLARQILKQVAAKHSTKSPKVTQPENIAQLEEMAQALIDENEDAGAAFVSRLRETGVSPEEIYLSYLAGAARLLGAWWETDRVSFAEVTIGASRIYGILRVIDESYKPREVKLTKRALFVAPSTETHRLGVKMASDLFRRKGWQIDLLLGEEQEAILGAIRKAGHGIVGLSSAGSHSITEIAKLVLAIRIHHPEVFILISGQAMDEMEETVAVMQPNALAKDFDTALETLEEYWLQNLK